MVAAAAYAPGAKQLAKVANIAQIYVENFPKTKLNEAVTAVGEAAAVLIGEAFKANAAESRLLPSGVGGTGAAYKKETGQGLYVLRNEAGNIRYVGRGDAPARIQTHADSIDKSDLIGDVLFENNLTKAQAKGLEQRLINEFGGATAHFPDSALLNKINSYSSTNPKAPLYRDVVTDALWQDTLKKVGQ